MHSYTVDEVIEDIHVFEGLVIQMEAEPSSIFTRLYSDLYSEPLSNDCKFKDLEKRVSDYTESSFIPGVDFKPSPGMKFTTYFKAGEASYRKYGEYEDIEEATKIFYDKDVDSNRIAIVDHSYLTVDFYERILS